MFHKLDERKILFIDIETVSLQPSFNDLPQSLQYHWQKKCKRDVTPEEVEATQGEVYDVIFKEKAGISAEFGKIVCISVGILLKDKEGEYQAKIKSFADEDEMVILMQFIEMIVKYYNSPSVQYLFGHNIREFDIPYICRRMIINGLDIPDMLDLAGKKPWETKQIIDTMEYWRFGDYKSFTSLDLIASVLGVESSKSDIDGSQVSKVFWEDNNLQRIAAYCERDVLVMIQLFLRMQNLQLVKKQNIEFSIKI